MAAAASSGSPSAIFLARSRRCRRRATPIRKLARQRSSWVGLFMASATIVAVTSPFLRAQAQKPNVLLVTIDTVRADHVGAYGYTKPTTPTLDRLAREGVRFADATSQAPLTGPAHAAILTGSYPGRFGMSDNAATPLPESATTIGELCKAAGYRTAALLGDFIVDRQYG